MQRIRTWNWVVCYEINYLGVIWSHFMLFFLCVNLQIPDTLLFLLLYCQLLNYNTLTTIQYTIIYTQNFYVYSVIQLSIMKDWERF